MGHLLINIKKAMTISGEPFALYLRIDPAFVQYPIALQHMP